MKTDPTLVFVTGAPGSAWSMMSTRLKKSLDYFDLSDEVPGRRYKIPEHHRKRYEVNDKDWAGRTHVGVYYGPYHEFGNGFDNIEKNYSKEEFINECLKPYNGEESHKLIRSHWFAYNLDWIWDNCKGHKLFLVWRDAKASKDWWYNMGGWDIHYPPYTWYDNDERMWRQMQEETNCIEDFAERKGIEFFDYKPSWITDFHPEAKQLQYKAEPNFEDQIKLAYVEIT